MSSAFRNIDKAKTQAQPGVPAGLMLKTGKYARALGIVLSP